MMQIYSLCLFGSMNVDFQVAAKVADMIVFVRLTYWVTVLSDERLCFT